MSNISFADNHQKFAVTRVDLESQGIPSFYYDILQYQVYETNAAVDKWIKEGTITAGDLHLESSLKEAKDRYWNEERPQLVSRIAGNVTTDQ